MSNPPECETHSGGIAVLLDRENWFTGLGGARRDRTDDLMLAKHALYQLSYGPDGVIDLSSHQEFGRPGQT